MSKQNITNRRCIFRYFFVGPCGVNGSDEHTVGVSSPRLKSPLYCAGAMQGKENGSSPGTNRRQPGGCRQSRWLCWALQFVGWNTACRDIFPPFSLTSLLTLCLFSFSFKIALEKGGGKKNLTKMKHLGNKWLEDEDVLLRTGRSNPVLLL